MARSEEAVIDRPLPVRRVWQLVGAIALVAVAFAQNGGFVVPDTKLDLVVDPVGFLTRSLSAWDPQAAFGQVQNQAYGYLWPMGPFFALGDLAGLQPWVVQRLWWALLLVVAYAGMLRLLSLWFVGTPTTRIIASLVYALSPRVLSVLGTISSEAWPLAVLPWILIPLVQGARGGSPRPWALLSALAVACLGAVNAVASLAVLVPAVLYLLTRARGPRRRSLAGWWITGVALASLWWVIPLLVQSRVAPPFLSAIESAAVTNAPTSALNALRGTAQWLAYIGGSGSGAIWDAGGWLAVSPWAVVATAAVAALGIGGFACALGGERRFLGLTLLAGALAVGIGYAGAAGSPVAGTVQALLDGPLAPLRNVHKADPLLRLPLAVGLAAVLAAMPGLLGGVAAHMVDVRDAARERRYARVLAMVITVPLLLLAVLPALQGRIAPPGSFLAIPGQWKEAADAVAQRGQGNTTTLLVPASNFGSYAWGRPLDEPMAALARSPWAVRNAIPLGAPGATRWLDGVQALLASGVRSETLAPALRAAGVGQLLLRNDLDQSGSVPSAAAARATLLASPGISRVAGFGYGGSSAAGLPGIASGAIALPALEVFAVSGDIADAQVVDRPVTAVAGPEALPAALAGTPTRLQTDSTLPAEVLTDTYRLRSQNFGAERGRDLSVTLDASADATRGRPAADISPWGDSVPRAVLEGPPAVTASSSAADPFGFGYRQPGAAPIAAADGDTATAWVSAIGDRSPWWQRTFPARPVDEVVVRVATDAVFASLAAIDIEVGGQTRTVTVPSDGVVRADFDGVEADGVRVVLRPLSQDPVSLIDVEVVGLEPATATVHVPGTAPAARLEAAPGSRGACVVSALSSVVCVKGSAVVGEDDARWARSLLLDSPAALTAVTVAARPSTATGSLVDAARGLIVTGRGSWLDDPLARPGAAFDNSGSTAWLVDPRELAPEVTITYPTPVTVTGLAVSARMEGARVESAVVAADGQGRRVDLGAAGVGRFDPLTATTFTVQLGIAPQEVTKDEEETVGPSLEPRRIEEITLIGARSPASVDVTVPCGAGPVLTINGTSVPVSITADPAEVAAGAPVTATPCRQVTVQGATTVLAPSTAEWRVTAVDLGGLREPAVTPARTEWTSTESAEFSVPAGPEGRVLATTWGFNPGWTATVDGSALVPVRVDGWRQGWALPAAATELRIVADFPAGRWHRAGLLVGAAALALLIALALRRSAASTLPAVGPATGARPAVVAAAVAIPLLVGGPAGALTVLVAAAAILLLGRRHAAVLAAAALTLGAVGAAVQASWGGGTGALAGQVGALLAAACVGLLSADMGSRMPQDRTLDQVPAELGRDVRAHQAE